MPTENTYDTKKIILFGVLLLVVVAVIGFFIFKKIGNPSDATDPKNLFPFDGTVVTPGTGTSPDAPVIENPIIEAPITSTTTDRLRVVANYPVTALYPFLRNIVSSEPQFDPVTNRTVFISKTTPTNYLRFNAKQNGFLVDAEITKNIITITQKTDVSVPNSEEVWFANQGNAITYRTWDAKKQTIATLSGSIPVPGAVTYCTTPFTTTLTNKSKGDSVKELQRYINAKLSLNLTIDGAFGKKLASALVPLQRTLGIAETGTFDQATLEAINADCTNIIASQNQQSRGIQKYSGEFIDNGILRGDVSPDGTQIFFLRPTPSGVVGIISNSTGGNQKQVFSSPLTEWKPQWVTNSSITMTTLASSEAAGYMYTLNPITGEFKKILGPIQGLTTLSNPSGTMVLFGQSSGRNLSLSTYNITNGTLTQRDLATLPAKCTWQNDTVVVCAVPQGITSGQYPDDWYQGNVVFNDTFWLIDTIANTTTTIFSPEQKFDAHHLHMSPNNDYLYFINKIDGTLWSYRISNE